MIQIDLIRFNGDKDKFLRALPHLKRLGYKFDEKEASQKDVSGLNLICLNKDYTLNLASHQLSSNEISVEVLEKFEWYYKELERNKVEEAFDEIRAYYTFHGRFHV